MQVVAYPLYVSVLSTIMVNHILSQDILRPVENKFELVRQSIRMTNKCAKCAR